MLKTRLAPIVLAFTIACRAEAASLTPPNLTAATTLNNNDLLLVWPYGAGGPLESMQWSVFKGLLADGLSGTWLQPSNNLSDLASPTTARTNLGLGTAAVANTGTSGNVLGALNGSNTWSATQIFQGGSSTAPVNLAPGSVPASPNNGDLWTTSSGLFAQINGTTQQVGGKSGVATLTLALSNPGSSSFAYSAQSGPWSCSNGWVTIQMGLVSTPALGSGNGVLLISGLPYNISSLNGGFGLEMGPVLQANGSGFSGLSGAMAFQANSGTNVYMVYGGPQSNIQVTSSNLVNGQSFTLIGTFFYRTVTGSC